RVDFEKAADAIIAYHEYTAGEESKTIEDADTTQTAGGQDFNGISIPSGFSSSGTPIHRKTTATYDAQGRLDARTLNWGGGFSPSTRVFKHYYSRLKDHQAVELAYADYETTPKWYGPVSFAVRNQAGKVTWSGTVALSSNETTTALTGHVDETEDLP